MIRSEQPHLTAARTAMVYQQLWSRGVHDTRVLEAMTAVPRHRFVPPELEDVAYVDAPLPIGCGQTISQPLMVAVMVEAAEVGEHEIVLDVGTGCGYQAAVLARLARRVVSIEVVPELGQGARERFASLGVKNVEVVIGDGGQGWPGEAPYDAIIVAAACPRVPPPLLQQLAERGRLVAPVGDPFLQTLVRIRRGKGASLQENLGDCQFVPLVGTYGFRPVTGH